MFPCGDCDRSFTRKYNLLRHQRESCVARHLNNYQAAKRLKINDGASTSSASNTTCTACDISVPTNKMASHLRTQEHKANCCVNITEGVNLIRSAFKNRIASYRVHSVNNHNDYTTFFNDIKDKVVLLLEKSAENHKTTKVNMEVFARYILPTGGNEDIKSFNTSNIIIDQGTDIHAAYDTFVDGMFSQTTEFSEKDSGWAIVSILHLEVNINKFTPLHGSSFIPLPKFIQYKRAVVNVQNNDQHCFAWAVVSALFPTNVMSTEVNSYPHYSTVINTTGISQLSQCTQYSELPQLPPSDEQRLQKASQQLQQRLVLRLWLAKLNLQSYYSKLLSLEVTSLEDVYWLEDTKAKQVFNKDFLRWSTARQSLPTSKQRLDVLKAELWSEVVKTSNHQDAWTWGGMLVVSVSIAGLVTLAAMTQPSLAPEAKHTLLQYVTGKYLLPSNCKVNFEWSSPHPVGKTVSFIVQFYQRNGQPYPICDTDNFTVEVCGGTKKLAVITELGSPTDPNCANIARVKFSVRHAGQYRISATVGNQHVAGSPFTAVFVAGPAFAQRTLVIRHCSTVVCTSNSAHVLFIEPRDEYNNVCRYSSADDPTKGYTIDIVQLGSSSQDHLEIENNNYTVSLDYDWENQRVSVELIFFQEGCYNATIYYYGVVLHNGDFDIIVLNSSDSTLVQKNVASKNHNVSYDAKLVGVNGERMLKPKKVLCYVSPKQLIVKELILKFIPKRLYTFRLCPSTKFNFQPEFLKCSEMFHNSFTVDDGCQPRIELVSKDRNVIAATFAHFLLKNMGGSETFKDKQDFFFHEIRKFHQKHYHEKISLKVCRDKLLETSMKATKKFSIADWCKNFEITFQGEQGVDWGGLRREWFELVCAQLFDAKNELFHSFHEGQQSLVHPNPQRPFHLKLKHYEFAGKVVGKCLYESALGGSYRQLVRARFTRSFLAQVIGLRVHYKYFEQDDPDLYLSKIKYLLENNIDEIDMELYFVEEQYDSSGQLVKTVELIRNGSNVKVTNATKLQYLDALAQYRLATCIKDEMEAFLRGLNELIPDNLLSIFDENELELLLCGTGQYSIADFKAHHLINGNSTEFRRIVGWFWAAVGNFTQEEMARLLQFTTGCSQLPPGGFKELTPKFQITAAPTFGNLPTAHTCFNQLCLPDYDCYEQFEKSLLLAISEGTEGFGLI